MRKDTIFFLSGCLLIALSGCGKDVSSLTVVTGVGIDGIEQDYQITAEAIQLTHSDEESQSILLHAAGQSMTEGLNHTVPMTGRPLHCGHAQVLVIGHGTASYGVESLLTDILGDNSYPVSLLPVVAEHGAAEIMETKPVVGTLGSTELEKLVTRGQATCTNPAEPAVSFFQRVKAPGIEAVLPCVALRHNGETQVREIVGTAVFRDMRLKKILDVEESRALMWMLGRRGGELTVDGTLFRVVGNQRTLTADTGSGTLRLRLDLQTYVPLDNPENWKQRVALALRERCGGVMEQLRQAGCDAVGFGNLVYRRMPGDWAALQEDWAVLFQDYPVTISVEIVSVREGRIETKTAGERMAP
ncbi:MAG: hypothetical protein IK141_04850 [Clostridia bacterium]|nr:hypothetical protein [Clostridia bacterium]